MKKLLYKDLAVSSKKRKRVILAFQSSCVQGGKGNVDKEFYQRIMNLLKIALPSWQTKEFAYIVALTGLLVARTVMSIWLADVQGAIVKAIVNRNISDFIKRVILQLRNFL